MSSIHLVGQLKTFPGLQTINGWWLLVKAERGTWDDYTFYAFLDFCIIFLQIYNIFFIDLVMYLCQKLVLQLVK